MRLIYWSGLNEWFACSVGSHALNQDSSRSHSLLTVHLNYNREVGPSAATIADEAAIAGSRDTIGGARFGAAMV